MKILMASFALALCATVTPALANEAPIGNLPTPDKSVADDFRTQVDALYRMKEKAFAAQDADKVVEHL